MQRALFQPTARQTNWLLIVGFVSIGWALYLRGNLTEAIPLLERAARGAPDDPEINEHLGDVYYVAGRRIEARYAWRAALVRAEGDAATRIRGKIDVGLPTTRTAQR